MTAAADPARGTGTTPGGSASGAHPSAVYDRAVVDALDQIEAAREPASAAAS